MKAGGLHIIGTERHESRRVDNQLRGRSGRQGDPGSSRFYMSLEDPLLRIFAGERINRIMVMLKMPEGEAIEHRMVTRSIESAQRKVEARNFDIRKQLLEYDDVANDQRKTIYALRNEVLESQDVSPRVADLRAGVVADMFRVHVPEDSVEEQWDVAGLENALKAELNLTLPLRNWLEDEPELGDDDAARAHRRARRRRLPRARCRPARSRQFRQYERYVMLQILDAHWREHLAALDHLRQGIHLRGYAQKNPKQEYKREAFELFGAMVEAVKLEVVKTLTAVEIRAKDDVPQADDKPHVQNVQLQHGERRAERREAEGDGAGEQKKAQPMRAPRAEGRPQRSLPLRLGQEIQALPRQADLAAMAVNLAAPDRAARCIAVRGVELGVAMAGITKPGRKDLLVMRLRRAPRSPACSRRTASAPRRWCSRRSTCKQARVRALVVNTGNANAGTGEDGLKRAAAGLRGARRPPRLRSPRRCCRSRPASSWSRCPPSASSPALPKALLAADATGATAAEAIMTTDTVPKAVSRKVRLSAGEAVVTGIAKGAGMIQPGHGDHARLRRHRCRGAAQGAAEAACSRVADRSFNCITVDGDTSTNDAFMLIATGQGPKRRRRRATCSSSRPRSPMSRGSSRRRSCATARARPSSSRCASRAGAARRSAGASPTPSRIRRW